MPKACLDCRYEVHPGQAFQPTGSMGTTEESFFGPDIKSGLVAGDKLEVFQVKAGVL